MTVEPKNFLSVTLFPCAICNLNCSYCGIDKNKALYEVDKILEESFKTDYYQKKFLKYVRRNTFKRLEGWGGEPLMKIERLFPLFDWLVDNYPNFSEFFVSTNFSYPEWSDKIIAVLDAFGKHPNRKFHFEIQLSCDGPQPINDGGRGVGVTEKCLNNYVLLLDKLLEHPVPENVELGIHLKPTLTAQSIKQLQTMEDVKNYYKFFEKSFKEPYDARLPIRVTYGGGLPNTATPAPITKQEGIEFGNFVKLCRQLEIENRSTHELDAIEFMPFTNRQCAFNGNYKNGPRGCGVGESSISFLPNNIFPYCHLGFGEYVKSYNKIREDGLKEGKKLIELGSRLDNASIPTCMTEEEFDKFMTIAHDIDVPDSEQKMHLIASTVQMLAEAGQIDEKYKSPYVALRAARVFANVHVYCIADGIQVANTIALQPIGKYRETFNGAAEVYAETYVGEKI